MDIVYEVTNSKPANLISTINKYGVKVLRIVTLKPTKPLNPILAGLDVAPVELLTKAEVSDLNTMGEWFEQTLVVIFRKIQF